MLAAPWKAMPSFIAIILFQTVSDDWQADNYKTNICFGAFPGLLKLELWLCCS